MNIRDQSSISEGCLQPRSFLLKSRENLFYHPAFLPVKSGNSRQSVGQLFISEDISPGYALYPVRKEKKKKLKKKVLIAPNKLRRLVEPAGASWD